MAELKIYLSSDLNQKFRRIAMTVYGYGRGSISKAAEEALTSWCSKREQPSVDTSPPDPGEATTSQSGKVDSGINPEERIQTATGDDPKNPIGSNNSS